MAGEKSPVFIQQKDSDLFYVYAYLRKDGTPYYIGKGKGNRLLSSHNRRNSRSIKPPSEDRIFILQDNLSESESFFWEKFFIRMFRRKDNDLENGVLRNLTDGGEGTSGRIVSEQTRKKCSNSNKKYKGPQTSMWGKKRPDISKLHSKKWLITYPNGKSEEVTNLKYFCNNNNLYYSTMNKIANGVIKCHKGFTCEKIRSNDH